MSPQTPDVEVVSLETANSVPSPSPWERRSPDRRSDGAPTAETPSVSVTGIVSADSRCQHRYKNGKRCRLPGSEPQLGLCPRHFRQRLAAGLPACDDFSDLSKDLLCGPLEFSSAADLCEYLTRLLILITKGGVSPRRAAVLAYIANQLLHSHVVAEKEAGDKPTQFIFDLPRPKRDDVISPERAFVNRMAERYGSASRGSTPGSTDDKPGAKEST